MKTSFRTSVKVALVLVYLVIVAGALVRMTGSGMGCPDWPKCFGYYIPPTNEQQLIWEENKIFEKGQVIIKDEKLLIAKKDFTTSQEFISDNWEVYTKHDYATFNVYHTWTEYINRLCGALAGIACLVMAVMSLKFRKESIKIPVLSWLVVFLMGFQAWLGATVVYSVLNPIRITLHMIVALVIVAVILHILNSVSLKKKVHLKDNLFNKFIYLALGLSLIQIVLGTQVRQFVDHQIKLLGYDQMHLIMESPEVSFFIHRTFTFVVVGVALFMFLRNRKNLLGYNSMNWIMVMFALEVLSGIAMYYLDFPFGMQSIHLVVASILFGLQYYMLLESKNKD